MSDDITELERRITAALDRIGTGLEGLGSAAPEAAPTGEIMGEMVPASDFEAVQRALEDEKQVTEELEERLGELKQRHAQEIAELQAKLQAASGTDTLAMDAELQSLRAANADLRESNAALREAVAQNVAEPHLINKAMMAELEGLRATRAADGAEIEAVYSAISALLDGTPSQEETV